MIKNLSDKINNRIKTSQSLLCVGLDSDFEKLPQKFKKLGISDGVFNFNKKIIQETNQYAGAYKANNSFYAGYGLEGLKALIKTNLYLKKNFSDIPLIADCKRSEMGNSAKLVAKEIFEEFNFDALTVSPWFGFDTIEPYLQYPDKGIFVLCHDSNPSAGEIQDLEVVTKTKNKPVYEVVCDLVNLWRKKGNVFAEAPLTYPKVLERVREIIGDKMLILVAGLGAQGGKTSDLKPVITKTGGILVNTSRSIIFADSPQDAACNFFNEINKLRVLKS